MNVQAYRNLNTGLWSIKAKQDNKWVVIAHAEQVVLADVTVKQSEASRQRAIRTKQRNVHCMLIGTLVSVINPVMKRPFALPVSRESITCARGVTYNPFINKTLIYRDTQTEFTGSPRVLLGTDKRMYAS